MATIRKHASGGWQAIIRKTGYPPQSKTFAKKSEAEMWALNIENSMNKGIFQDTSEAERTTLDDLIDRFKQEVAASHYRKRDDEKEAWRFQLAHLSNHVGKYSLAAIDQNLINAYKTTRLNTVYVRPTSKPKPDPTPEELARRLKRAESKARNDIKKGRTPTPKAPLKKVGESTVRKEIFMLSKLMTFAQMECEIFLPRGNPVANVRKPREGKPRDIRLNAAKFERLALECQRSKSPLLNHCFVFAIETAARQAEVLSLTWENVNLDRKFALMKVTKNGEERAAPLSSRAVEVLSQMPKPESPMDLVFPVERETLYSAYRSARERAGIKNFTWHDLRHEALSRLAENGDFSILELGSISGHKTLQVLKKYTLSAPIEH